MIYGFPGRTFHNTTSAELDYLITTKNPERISMRDLSLAIINKTMSFSDELRIMYASKQSRISNAHKKWKGQNFGLQKTDALKKVLAFEEEYNNKAKSNPG